MEKIKKLLAWVKVRMPTLEKVKKVSVGTIAVILLLVLLVGWGLYERFQTPSAPSTKTATAENKSVAVCTKPQVTLSTPVEPPKPKRNNRLNHKKTQPEPASTPEKSVVAQAPKEGAECIVGEHHGVVKVVGGGIRCEWEESIKESPTPTPTIAPPAKLATAPVQRVQAVVAPVEHKSLLDGIDPDYGKMKSEPVSVEVPPKTRRVIVVVDRPQSYGGWYNYPLVPSPYYYTSPAYTPTVVAAPSVVTPAPSVVRPPAVTTIPATAGPVVAGRVPAVTTRP